MFSRRKYCNTLEVPNLDKIIKVQQKSELNNFSLLLEAFTGAYMELWLVEVIRR